MFVIYLNKTTFNNCSYYICFLVYKFYKANNVLKITKINRFKTICQ